MSSEFSPVDDAYAGTDDATFAGLLEAQATWVEGANYGRPAAVMREAARRLRMNSQETP